MVLSKRIAKVCPAPAGVILLLTADDILLPSMPRTCGGDPSGNVSANAATMYAPHLRG